MKLSSASVLLSVLLGSTLVAAHPARERQRHGHRQAEVKKMAQPKGLSMGAAYCQSYHPCSPDLFDRDLMP